ncbi:MAG: hypothetical protein EXR52_02775 [Dehalococcoidia bacterium]|nr:hypothetical protein [Dehalococcoidia bacterium]
MTQPATEPLVIGPMGVGQVVDASFTLMRRHYNYLVVVAAWGTVAATLISLIGQLAFGRGLALLASGQFRMTPAQMRGTNVEDMLSEFLPDPLYWPVVLLAGVVSVWAQGALLAACGLLINRTGSTLSSADAYRQALGRVIAFLLQSLLFIVLAMVVLGVWVASIVLVPLFTISLVLLLPALIYVTVRLSLVMPALFIEQLGPISSLRRSWQLTHGAWWHTFGVGVVMTLVVIVLGILAGAVGAIAGLATFIANDPAVIVSLTMLISMVVGILIAPLSPAVGAVLLYELRVRNEGFDIVQRAQ